MQGSIWSSIEAGNSLPGTCWWKFSKDKIFIV